MVFVEIEWATPLFDEALALRDDVLRKPLNLKFELTDIKKEWTEHHFGVLNEDLKLIASITLKPLKKKLIKMRQVAVSGFAQGKGVGSYMVQQCEQWCLENNYFGIEMHTRKTAIPFYEKLGYEIIGEEFTEVGIPHKKMMKNLL